MSTIVKYSSGSTYTIVPNKVDIEKVQDLDGQYHIPYSSIVGMMRLGLGVQKITVSGDSLDMSACLWHDVVAISFDSGVSYQTVYFAGVPYTSDCWSGIYPYALSLLASPLKEQTAVRYPTTGYKWGNQSITGISQAGNVNAYPIIHYLAPLFYAPLSNTLIDFAGQAVTFTRTAAKYHGSVLYPINTPIYDAGLYLAGDTAQDVALWTPPASTLRTVAMQIKSRYPSPWSIGGGGVNLLTANQSNAETDTTGMESNGTLTRNTSTPIAGSGDFKVVAASTYVDLRMSANVSVATGRWYNFQFLAKGTGTGVVSSFIAWLYPNGDTAATNQNTPVTIPALATPFNTSYQAPAGATQVKFFARLESCAVGNIMYVDSLMIEVIPATLIIWHYWSGDSQSLKINTVDNSLRLTADTGNWVNVAFPTAPYLAGTIVDIVVLDDTSHAITVVVHPAGGSWTPNTGTLASIVWPSMFLGNLEGSIANLIQYPYVLTSAEYQALAYSSLSLLFNALYIGNRYAGEIVKDSDKRLLNALGSDISALLGGVDIPIGSSAVAITQTQGLAARWYVEVKRTDV